MGLECTQHHEKMVMTMQYAAIRENFVTTRHLCMIHFIERENRPEGVDVPVHNDNKDKEKVKE